MGIDSLARYYDSRTGTFCSADPLAGSPSDPQSWNRYPYGRNDPIDITDPSGKHWWDWLGAIAGVALAPVTDGASLFGYLSFEQGEAAATGRSLAMPGFDFGGMSLGTSWNGTPIMPYGGLTNGVQNALGLPTMADVAPIFDATRNPQAIDCDGYHYTDPIMGALEFTAKAGPEVQIGWVKAGFSFYKNLATGETGGKGELNAGLFSIEADNRTPQGGSLNGGGPKNNEYTGSFGFFYKNFTTGRKGFDPSKTFSFGAQALIGMEVKYNSDKAYDIWAHNQRCGLND